MSEYVLNITKDDLAKAFQEYNNKYGGAKLAYKAVEDIALMLGLDDPSDSKVTEHEYVMISAARDAIGRKEYKIGCITNYISNRIDDMSDECKSILIDEISNPLMGNYGDDWTKAEWMCLLDKLKEAE